MLLLFTDQWLGDRLDIPFEPQYPTDPIGLYPVKTTNTNDLLMDFDSVYDSVEYTHLTPPQTPPEIKRASFIEQVCLYYNFFYIKI